MDRIGKKCVLYSRVSTEMQVDGFSLAGQKTCLTRFVEREEMKIVGEYEDAGKSGKSIEGRPAFKRMLDDIKNGLQVDYVIVYKLSRFGRNAADVLNSLELIQDYGVNLICTDEGIDSSQASGRLLISVLSAVAQIERENILEQTMNGRREKARQGLWNGGMAPYGYRIKDGKLVVNQEEADIVKLIFDKYANTTMSAAEVARYCNDQNLSHGSYGNRVDGYWSPSSICKMISNPTYIGMIEWGHRQNTKIKGSREMKRVYTNENIIVSEGQHEPIISKELYDKCQTKRKAIQEKLKTYVPKKGIHILTGLLVCPKCGGKMSAAMNKKTLIDGRVIRKEYYVCHNAVGHKKTCDYSKLYDASICEQLLKNALAVIINNQNFIDDLEKEFVSDNQEALIKKELENYQKKLKDKNKLRFNLENEIDNMDTDIPGYEKRREVLNGRLNKIYNEVFDLEDQIDVCKNKLKTYSDDLISAEYIKNLLRNFSEVFENISLKDKKELLNALISKIYINERDDKNFEFSLKGIEFKFPVFKNTKILNGLDKDDLELLPVKEAINTVVQNVEFGDKEGQIHLDSIYKVFQPHITHEEALANKEPVAAIRTDKSNILIADYVKEHYNLVVYGCLIRATKQEIGIKYRGADKGTCSFVTTHITLEKYDAIVAAIKALDMIPEAFANNYDELASNARLRLIDEIKQRGSKSKKFDLIIKEIREENDVIITYGNIHNVLRMLDVNNPPKRYKDIPTIEKSLMILDKLIKYEIVVGDKLSDIIYKVYKDQVSIKVRRKKVTNDDIIEYVKDYHNLNVNPSMIADVREELGIVVKVKDRRYNPTKINRRVPNAEQKAAIIDAMVKYKLIDQKEIL